MEKFFKKYSPKAIRVFFVPMMSMVITIPVILLLLGPLVYQVGEWLSALIIAIHSRIGWLATGLLAAILPFMISTDMHKAMIPYVVSSLTMIQREPLYLPASLAHNISETGACFAVAIRTKDERQRSTAISAGISALFGITEPALYRITLQNKQALIGVVSGSLIGGLFIGYMAVEAFAAVGPGLASITMFASPDNSMNIVWSIVTFVLSLLASLASLASFIVTLFIYCEEEPVQEMAGEPTIVVSEPTTKSPPYKAETLLSPIVGEVIPLNEVKDEVFSTGMMGSGVAIIPEEGVLYAPIAGGVKMVFKTAHALWLETPEGREILFHIGIDTVELNG